jgi:hypothetical protein
MSTECIAVAVPGLVAGDVRQVVQPHPSPVGRLHPVGQRQVRAGGDALADRLQHPLAVVGVQNPLPQTGLVQPPPDRIAEHLLGPGVDEPEPPGHRVALPHDRVQPGHHRLQPRRAGLGGAAGRLCRIGVPAGGLGRSPVGDLQDAAAHQPLIGRRQPQQRDLTRHVAAVGAPMEPLEPGPRPGQRPGDVLLRSCLRRPPVRLHRRADLNRSHAEQRGTVHPEQLLGRGVDRHEPAQVHIEDDDRVRRVLDQRLRPLELRADIRELGPDVLEPSGDVPAGVP